MTEDINLMDSITEEYQNSSKVAKDEEVLEISERLLAQNREAYEVLAQ